MRVSWLRPVGAVGAISSPLSHRGLPRGSGARRRDRPHVAEVGQDQAGGGISRQQGAAARSECRMKAAPDQVQSVEDKSVLLDMAQAWIRLTDQSARMFHLIDHGGTLALTDRGGKFTL